MKIGILGSGFGVYGWLVAIKTKNEILTFKKYKKLLNLEKIQKIRKKIKYFNDENEILYNSDKIVIAKTPFEQERIVKKIIKLRLKKLYLEKPLASDPIKSIAILKLLKKIEYHLQCPFHSKKHHGSEFYKKILQKNFKHAEIIWNFKSKFNHSKNWKNKKKYGGEF